MNKEQQMIMECLKDTITISLIKHRLKTECGIPLNYRTRYQGHNVWADKELDPTIVVKQIALDHYYIQHDDLPQPYRPRYTTTHAELSMVINAILQAKEELLAQQQDLSLREAA